VSQAIASAVFGALFDTSTEALFVLELASGRILAANPSVADLLALGVEDILGRTLDDLYYEPGRDVSAPGHYEEVALRRGDDYPVFVTLHVAHIADPTHGTLAACTARDTTERRGLERELFAKHSALIVAHHDLERAYTQLNEAKEQLDDRNREIALLAWRAAVGELVAGIAHHLNNPVGALASTLRGLATQLERGTADRDALARMIARAMQITTRIESNVNAIVTASKQATGNTPQTGATPDELVPILATFSDRMDAIPTKEASDARSQYPDRRR
jgi:PAS domain S-box-containing protein